MIPQWHCTQTNSQMSHKTRIDTLQIRFPEFEDIIFRRAAIDVFQIIGDASTTLGWLQAIGGRNRCRRGWGSGMHILWQHEALFVDRKRRHGCTRRRIMYASASEHLLKHGIHLSFWSQIAICTSRRRVGVGRVRTTPRSWISLGSLFYIKELKWLVWFSLKSTVPRQTLLPWWVPEYDSSEWKERNVPELNVLARRVGDLVPGMGGLGGSIEMAWVCKGERSLVLGEVRRWRAFLDLPLRPKMSILEKEWGSLWEGRN